MAMKSLATLIGKAPVPVFAARGCGAEKVLSRLRLAPGITLTDSPRHASVLLVLGDIPAHSRPALKRLHDQLPHPRATLWCQSEPFFLRRHAAPRPTVVREAAQVPAAVRALQTDLLCGTRITEPDLLADKPPAAWRGKGEHKQGGDGMMGGKPYGRPMAMTAEDIRDGLQLDALSFSIGPFYPTLPLGLSAWVTLQGDVVQAFRIASAPFATAVAPCFSQSLSRPVPIARLELARARYHCDKLAGALQLNGLRDLARRVWRFAQFLEAGETAPEPAAETLAKWSRAWYRLQSLVRCSGFLHTFEPGSGHLGRRLAATIGGVAARASGIAQDARLEDPAYRRLDFCCLTQREGDSQARWRQYLAEINQSLNLAHRAAHSGLQTDGCTIETPLGRLAAECAPADQSHLLEGLLPGMEWNQAMATSASLDLAAIAETQTGRA